MTINFVDIRMFGFAFILMIPISRFNETFFEKKWNCQLITVKRFYNSNWLAGVNFFHVFLPQSRNFNWLIVRRCSMNEMHIWLFLFFICFGIYRPNEVVSSVTVLVRFCSRRRLSCWGTFFDWLSRLAVSMRSSSSLFLDKGPYTTIIIASSS